MLVRFLSFCATVLGTARYKAIFLSSLTLVVALSGVTAVALIKGSSNPHSGASATVKEKQSTDQENGATPHLGGARKQNPKQPVEQPDVSNTPAVSDTTTVKPTETAPKTPAAAVDIITSASEVRLTGEETKSITVNTSDESKVTWSVATSDQTGGLQLVIPTQNEEHNLTFQVKADRETLHRTHTIVVTAKDATRGLTITKSITVVVQ